MFQKSAVLFLLAVNGAAAFQSPAQGSAFVGGSRFATNSKGGWMDVFVDVFFSVLKALKIAIKKYLNLSTNKDILDINFS